ncbi:MAG: hypothetical protein DSY41_04945, partial [Candidatus Poseidoniales archaeon]
MPRIAALCIALVILATPLSGCYSFEEESSILSEDLSISPEVLLGAHFQSVEFSSSSSMSVHVPYLVIDAESGYVVNGTTLDFDGAGTTTIEMLAPSNLASAHFLLGELGRDGWPLRATNQSWSEWFNSSEFGSAY